MKMFNKSNFPQTMTLGNDKEAANGPAEVELSPHPEIEFTPSGNTPVVDLGAPPYDLSLAERRRN